MAQLTPMMQQYMKIKEECPDALLMYRLGDFYEFFFEDAKIAAKELDLVLTGRDCGLEERAPMCGVPFHAADSYINKLISKNYKVAICEQLEDPATAKGMVKRGIIRIVTPGTVTDSAMLEDKENNYILSIAFSDQLGLAYCDVSTGAFFVYQADSSDAALLNELNRVKPREVLIPDGKRADFEQFLNDHHIKDLFYNSYFDWAFEKQSAYRALTEHFHAENLRGYGCEQMIAAQQAGGALIAYLHDTQKNSLLHINTIRVVDQSRNMMLDATAIRNLELTQTIRDGEKRGSLLWLLDKTKTSLGARMLKQYIENPLNDLKAINNRLEAVLELKEDLSLAEEIKTALKDVYDLDRIITKISYASLNARDCLSLKMSLAGLPRLKELLSTAHASLLLELARQIDPLDDIYALIEAAICEDAGLSIRDGGIIKTGYNCEIDQLRDTAQNGKNWLAELEAKEKEATGIPKLKIGYNKVFGYYIEVTNSYADQIPYRYIRKQTLVNCERFITEELKSMEDSILNAEERQCAKEYAVFGEIRLTLEGAISRIQKSAVAIAAIDVLQSFAAVAYEYNYVMPDMTTDGKILIQDGRHPVVEKMSRQASFVPNDVKLDLQKNNMLLITGPNMAGKSTYMRQVGLIVLMAHIGSFVPAQAASICLVDRIFTRVGASDDLASGQSTFMVEMNELANILNHATQNSLIILDEIGRGTSTIDGLSIAWATVEYIISRIGAKTMFATHYHELIELEQLFAQIKNYSIAAREFGNEIVFLHKIVPHGTDKSFGVEVAKLAGLPEELVVHARQLLQRFQAQELDLPKDGNEDEQKERTPANENTVIRKLRRIDVNTLTPLEALNLIGELQREIDDEPSN